MEEKILSILTVAIKDLNLDPDPELIQNFHKAIKKEARKQATSQDIPKSFNSNEFCDIYSSIVRKVISNYNQVSNLSLSEICELTHQDLCPQIYAPYYKEFYDRENIQLSSGIKNNSEFKCFKCKSTDLVATTQQLRSADEGSTTQFTCNNCNHRWNC